MSKRAPLIALVGRPNVGKSRLFNRLVDTQGDNPRSIVHDQPGVTRDRLFGDGVHDGFALRFVDTGGFDSDPDDPLLTRMRHQTQLAIEEADFVLLVLDSSDGVRPADSEVVQILRRASKPFAAVVNKVDVPDHEERCTEFYELGIDRLHMVSAEHARGVGELCEFLCETLDPPEAEAAEEAQRPLPVREEEEGAEGTRIEWEGGPIRVAVIGRPNVGKSSLINRLLGKERLLATDVAGTTRDSVDTDIERDGQPFVFIDTAGIRRKRSISNQLEQFSVYAARHSIERADVAVVVLDGSERPSAQDARIISLAHDRGKGVVLVANKWDLIDNTIWREKYPEAVRVDFSFASYAKLLRVSAKTGRSVEKIFAAIVVAQQERHRRVTTSELNRFFKQVIDRTPPPVFKGKKATLYYATQPMVRPPTFVFVAGRPDSLPDAYCRFLRNELRDRYGFEGTPVWLKFRPRGKVKDQGKILD